MPRARDARGRGEVIELDISHQHVGRRTPPAQVVQLTAAAPALAGLALTCLEVAATGAPQAFDETGLVIRVYRTDRALQVLVLDPPGLLLAADAGGLRALAATLGALTAPRTPPSEPDGTAYADAHDARAVVRLRRQRGPAVVLVVAADADDPPGAVPRIELHPPLVHRWRDRLAPRGAR